VRDQRRRFGKFERFALWAAEGGLCAECGDELQPGWHADHVLPFSKGGITDVTNGRATCPTCNLQKGNRSVPQKPPRHKWQQRAIDKYTAHDLEDFLMEATPGAGKTRVEAEISALELEACRVERVIAVVPTASLREQTALAFQHWTGLQLDYEWESGTAFPRRPFVGVVVTYQAIDMAPEIFRTAVSRAATLAILDEIHHAGDRGSWAISLRRAFEHAKRRLLSSGTPFRSDNRAIPFVTYDGNKAKADFSISYGEALQEGVVRSVYFPRCGGSMEWAASGQRSAVQCDV
jgi:superfamily II DNA or RNA helicase